MIETNLAGPEASVEDRILKARLMAADPEKSKRREAIPIWKQVLQDPSATAEDRLAMVRAYLNAGNWIDASDSLRYLVATNDKDPRFLAFYINELVKHNELSSAETYCSRLEEMPPTGSPPSPSGPICSAPLTSPIRRSAYSRTSSTTSTRCSDRAPVFAVSEKLAEIAGNSPNRRVAPRRGMHRLAESRCEYVKKNPGQELLLAVFLGEHGKVDESLNIFDDVLQSSKVDDFSRACSLVVEGGKCNKEQMQHMSKIIEAAMQKFKRATPLLLALAGAAECTPTRLVIPSRLTSTVRRPSKALDNARALNNLAVLQALQGVNAR